jgi:uncharacterized protein (DUF1330 family)
MTVGGARSDPETPRNRLGGAGSVPPMVILCVLLYAVPGAEPELVAYEDHVLGLLAAHGANVRSRVRAQEPGDGPYEVHVLEFPDEHALDAYMADPARVALADQRDRAIARTEVLRVDALG